MHKSVAKISQTWLRGLHSGIVSTYEEIGAIGREIEYRQGGTF
jgi:hypothetical protein